MSLGHSHSHIVSVHLNLGPFNCVTDISLNEPFSYFLIFLIPSMLEYKYVLHISMLLSNWLHGDNGSSMFTTALTRGSYF